MSEEVKPTSGEWKAEGHQIRVGNKLILTSGPSSQKRESIPYAEMCANANLGGASPDMLSALKHSLPYMEHALKFFRYQHAGKEFYPNREEAEANIAEVTAAIRKAERRG